MLNWKVRVKNLMFWIQVGGAVITTALAYNSMHPTDFTTWSDVGNMLLGIVMNPYLLVCCGWSIWNALNDPTTSGFSDSARAMTYDLPSKEK